MFLSEDEVQKTFVSKDLGSTTLPPAPSLTQCAERQKNRRIPDASETTFTLGPQTNGEL